MNMKTKLNAAVFLEDDRLPYLTMLTGTDIFEGGLWLLGAPAAGQPSFRASFCAHPAAEAARVKVPRLEDPLVLSVRDGRHPAGKRREKTPS